MTTLLQMPPNAVYRVEVGSTAYGINIPGTDDFDEVVIVIETVPEVMGSGIKNRFERTAPEGVSSGPGDVDRQIYSLRSFAHLAAKGNPSIIGCFWAPQVVEGDGPYANSIWARTIREGAELFMSEQVIRSYRGYMFSAVEKVVKQATRPDLVKAHGYDTKAAAHVIRLGLQCQELIHTGELLFPTPSRSKLLAIRRGDVLFSEWLAWANEINTDLLVMQEDCGWPPQVDRTLINEWLADIHLNYWGYPA